jgi:ferrous iron transport protein B
VSGAAIKDAGFTLIDTPGIGLRCDSETTKLALEMLNQQDGILLVLRATHAREEWETFFPLLPAHAHRLVILLTFSDKIKAGLKSVLDYLAGVSGAPVLTLNARKADENVRQAILMLLSQHVTSPLLPHLPPVASPSLISRQSLPGKRYSSIQ